MILVVVIVARPGHHTTEVTFLAGLGTWPAMQVRHSQKQNHSLCTTVLLVHCQQQHEHTGHLCLKDSRNAVEILVKMIYFQDGNVKLSN